MSRLMPCVDFQQTGVSSTRAEAPRFAGTFSRGGGVFGFSRLTLARSSFTSRCGSFFGGVRSVANAVARSITAGRARRAIVSATILAQPRRKRGPYGVCLPARPSLARRSRRQGSRFARPASRLRP
ncbi:MAG: hypothetical protein JWO52_4016 [Gammaproteobacteria bacterium]|nr:hypothetical protein [Gammaproteobacteria bacterium]